MYGYPPLPHLLKDAAKGENEDDSNYIAGEATKATKPHLTGNLISQHLITPLAGRSRMHTFLHSGIIGVREEMHTPWTVAMSWIRQTSNHESPHLPPANSLFSEKWLHLSRND